MIKLLLIFSSALALNCNNIKTNIRNDSGVEWNKTDDKMLKSAKNRCKQLYGKCLKIFVKVDKDNYWAVCGVE